MSRSKVQNLLLLKQIHSAVSQIKKGKLDKALETLDKAENAARKAKANDALYYVLFTRGSILYTASKYDEALETYEKTLIVGEELLKTDPENPDYLHYRGTVLSNTANLLKKKGEKARAAEYYFQARQTYLSLMTKDPDNAVFNSYAGENLNNYAVLLAETGSFSQACEVLKEAIGIYEKLLEEKPDNLGYQAELSVALSQFGSCLSQQSQENNILAKEKMEKALRIQENLLVEQPENENIKEAILLTRERINKLEEIKDFEGLADKDEDK
ncbi:MAG: tetratricopeptide repeat protein [Methanosarcina sp.]